MGDRDSFNGSAGSRAGFEQGRNAEPVHKGRLPGAVNKVTQVRILNLRSALEILRANEGENPIETSMKIARVLEGMSKRRMDNLQANAAPLSGEEFDRIVNTLYKAANIQLRLADFVFPKPGRIDLPEGIAPAKAPKTMAELSEQLQERGLPPWVFGDDAPILDLAPDEVARNGNGADSEVPE